MKQESLIFPFFPLMDRKTKRIFLRMCRSSQCADCPMPELGGGICGWKQMGNNWPPTQEELKAIKVWGEAHRNDEGKMIVKKNEISTQLGRLKATVRNDPDYPGIDIRLDRDGKSILLAWVEVDQYQQQPALKMRLYADCKDDEPTDDRSITPGELDDYFASLANGARELV